jgi:hypothetical protein
VAVRVWLKSCLSYEVIEKTTTSVIIVFFKVFCSSISPTRHLTLGDTGGSPAAGHSPPFSSSPPFLPPSEDPSGKAQAATAAAGLSPLRGGCRPALAAAARSSAVVRRQGVAGPGVERGVTSTEGARHPRGRGTPGAGARLQARPAHLGPCGLAVGLWRRVSAVAPSALVAGHRGGASGRPPTRGA